MPTWSHLPLQPFREIVKCLRLNARFIARLMSTTHGGNEVVEMLSSE